MLSRPLNPIGRGPIIWSVDAEREREFEIDELFFSTTNEKGIIASGNEVFSRVAAYKESEMIGKPHSLIRHPDMPRCVFKALWDTIEQGQTIAAYVKNRAKTGQPYWVMATVVPCSGGYLSVRLKPSSKYFELAKAVYPELRALELELGGEREIARKQAMAASGDRLFELLAGAGFADYTSFMHQALATELASRAAHTQPPREATGPQRRVVDHIRKACLAIAISLDGLFGADLDGYMQLTELSRQLSAKSGFVLELAERLRLFALNALLASSKLGDDGAVLHTVAGIMRATSDSMRGVIAELSGDLKRAGDLLAEVGFRVSVAKLQSLMAIQFNDEVNRRRRPGPDWAKYRDPRVDDIALVAGCLDESLRALRTALEGLDNHLRRVATNAAHLKHDLRVMGTLEANGRIEAARTGDALAVVQLFSEIHSQIAMASAGVEEFAAVTKLGGAIASRTAIEELDGAVDRIRRDTARLAAQKPSAQASTAQVLQAVG